MCTLGRAICADVCRAAGLLGVAPAGEAAPAVNALMCALRRAVTKAQRKAPLAGGRT